MSMVYGVPTGPAYEYSVVYGVWYDYSTCRTHHAQRTPTRRPGGWDPSAESDNSKSEQVKHCMDLEHCMHWLHLEPTHLLHTHARRRADGHHCNATDICLCADDRAVCVAGASSYLYSVCVECIVHSV
jgi:hypothetical protein